MAKIITKAGSDQTLILGTREGLLYPFTSPNWTDLRLSAWLSLTTGGADDVSPATGVADITNIESLPYSTPRDSFWFGFKTNTTTFPFNAGIVFQGVAFATLGGTNSLRRQTNVLVTTPFCIGISYDGTTTRQSTNNVFANFPSESSSGYAVAMIARMTRPTGSSLDIRCSWATFPTGGFTSTPDIASLRSFTVTNSGGVGNTPTTSSAAPDAVFIYWPWNNSRLRIHAMMVEKYA
jgi:hypothetical protein